MWAMTQLKSSGLFDTSMGSPAASGAGRGVVLALKRLGRCRPFTQGGYDPVPEMLETHVERTDITVQGPVR